MARLAAAAQRAGYACIAVSVVAFVVGAATTFSTAVTVLVVVALVAATLTLAPGIVLGYAVRAAEREDRERGR